MFPIGRKRGVETLTVATVGAREVIDSGNQQQTIAQVREWQGMAGRDLLLEKIPEPEPGATALIRFTQWTTRGGKNGHVVIELKIRHE